MTAGGANLILLILLIAFISSPLWTTIAIFRMENQAKPQICLVRPIDTDANFFDSIGCIGTLFFFGTNGGKRNIWSVDWGFIFSSAFFFAYCVRTL